MADQLTEEQIAEFKEAFSTDSCILYCSICKRNVDCTLWTKGPAGNKIPNLDWKKARWKCSGETDWSQATAVEETNSLGRIIDRTGQLATQNATLSKKNLERYGADPPVHIWSLNDAAHYGTVKCRRVGCQYYANPVPYKKEKDIFKSTSKVKFCTGELLGEEKNKGPLLNLCIW
eukprot:TRINITY_DN38962_c0_g1_i1.p1 TRINITY_DN38962_c0_g1~~TRINITY_DN38962_c0_g1_i1.p1  ORF type:complete len:175 (-),score=34.00 TRINITY_DN38962_c0_g1_i1:239-763(-)